MIEIKRSFYDWIRKWILRKTATPYECYWRDRAFKAEAEVARHKLYAQTYRWLWHHKDPP